MISTFILIGIIVLILVVIVLVSYVKAPPSQAFIISGLNKNPRVLIGKGGFRLPFFERLDKIYLGQITVDIKTETSVPTNDFINVDVDAVAKIRVKPTDEGIRLAGKNFLNMKPLDIANQLQDSLQGNMREIIGTLELKELNTNRDGFSDQVMEKAAPDMEKLGIEILSCNIQNITDREGLIKDLGADNTSKIKKEAAITRITAEKEISIKSSQANKEANDFKVESEMRIAEKNNELSLKKSDLKLKEDAKKAEADTAYEIQKQEQQKIINTKSVEAEIEKTKKQQILSQEQIIIRENELKAEINKKVEAEKYKTEKESEAEKYKTETEAKAILEQRKRNAEAEKYETEQKAEAMKQKAEAYKLYNGAAVAEMMIKILPEMAANIAKPMESIDSVNIYGTNGNEVSGVTGNIPVIVKQVFDTMSQATGVDMKEILKTGTIEAATTRNINISKDIDELKDNIVK